MRSWMRRITGLAGGIPALAGIALGQAGWLGPAPGGGGDAEEATATVQVPVPKPRRSPGPGPDPFFSRIPTKDEYARLGLPISMSLREQPMGKVLELIASLGKLE